MERGAWWVTVHGVTKTLTQLSNYHPPPKKTHSLKCVSAQDFTFSDVGPLIHKVPKFMKEKLRET